MEKDEYRLGKPIVLNAGRGKGMKKTKKYWIIKELKLDGTTEVEESRRQPSPLFSFMLFYYFY